MKATTRAAGILVAASLPRPAIGFVDHIQGPGHLAAAQRVVHEVERPDRAQAGASTTSSRLTSTAVSLGTTAPPRASIWVFVKAAPNSRISDE